MPVFSGAVAGSPAIGADAGAHLGRATGIRISADVDAVAPGCDVFIDFTRPAGTLVHLAACAQAGIAAVVGTTGFDADGKRQIAERGRYPAINVLKSVSRTMPRAADPAFLPMVLRARQVMATYADMEELIRLGAYRAGSSAEVDEAIRLHAPLEQFLAQAKEDATDLGQGYQRLEQILGALETEN